jgi:hypothetical protein
VHTTAARVHEHDVFEPKVDTKTRVKEAYGHSHVNPAFLADAAPTAARAHVIIVRKIDIEDEFALCGFESVFLDLGMLVGLHGGAARKTKD